MLDTRVYIAAINKAAFTPQGDAETIKKVCDYCRKFGLCLATTSDGGLTLQRVGIEPYALKIAIDGNTIL